MFLVDSLRKYINFFAFLTKTNANNDKYNTQNCKNKFHKYELYMKLPFINFATKLLISISKINTVKIVPVIYDIKANRLNLL